jgi:Calpain family cysteine protease
MLTLALLLAVFAQDPAPAAQPKPQAARTFADVVRAHFDGWDQDRDDTLSKHELDALCVSHRVQGEEAAAAAALKRVVRSGKYEVPPLTKEVLSKPAAPAKAAAKSATPATPAPSADSDRAADDADRRDSGEPVQASRSAATTAPSTTPSLRKPNFQSSYASGLKKIRNTKRALFLDETPDIDACKQGPLGDCFFVAAVGAFAHRDPAALKRMFVEQQDGSVLVRFGNGQSVAVTPLSDAELALSGSTGDEGLWLPVLEKAIGSLRQDANPEKYDTETATDAIARGGSTATMLRILTGHTTTRIALKKRPRSTKKDERGNPVLEPSQPAGEHAALAVRVREALTQAFANGRLAACGTLQEAQPKGIAQKHAYAVLAFDPAQDVVHLWNPHGNTHTPKGPAGLEHGYPTKAGRFSVPVAKFVRIFGSVVVETGEPLPSVDGPTSSGGGK